MTSSRPTGLTLKELVLDRKGDRSYEVLARDCGGRPTSKRLQQIATSPAQKNFLDPDTIRGLAHGLGVSVTQVVLASARSCGLDVRDSGDGDALVIGSAGDLTAEQRALILSLARELTRPRQAAAPLTAVSTLTVGGPPRDDDDLPHLAAARRARRPAEEQPGSVDPS